MQFSPHTSGVTISVADLSERSIDGTQTKPIDQTKARPFRNGALERGELMPERKCIAGDKSLTGADARSLKSEVGSLKS